MNIIVQYAFLQCFPGGSVVKVHLPKQEGIGDAGLIPGSWRSLGEGKDNPLQYSCLKNPMDRRAWWATVHGVIKSQTGLSKWVYTHDALCLLSPSEKRYFLPQGIEAKTPSRLGIKLKPNISECGLWASLLEDYV